MPFYLLGLFFSRMLRVKKSKILQYDLSSLDNAVKWVKAGEVSIRKAAEHFKVPKSTVGDRVTGKREIVVGRGRKPALPWKTLLYNL